MGAGADRYIRQYSYEKLSPGFQRELAGKSVLVIGAGALGSRSMDMMIRCGVGNITVFDNDIVELQNLQRQHIYREQDVGKKKAALLESYARQVNSEVNLRAIDGYFDADAAETLFSKESFDAILDSTDNYGTRFLLNRIGVERKLPVIFQALAGGTGFVFPAIPGGPCLSCFCHDKPDRELNAGNKGLFSPVCNIATGLAVAALFSVLKGEMDKVFYTYFDAWYPFSFKKFEVDRDPGCVVCGKAERNI